MHATVFPPRTLTRQECGPDQLRFLAWASSEESTLCLSGQEVLNLALPGCAAGQFVVNSGGRFICQPPTSIPTCGDKQYLSYTGSSYECRSMDRPPECGSNQVLTSTGGGFTCVNRTDDIPTCGSNQFLTFNGSSYQCATSEKQALPLCGGGQVVTSDGSSLSCTSAGDAAQTSSRLYGGTHTDADCIAAGGFVRGSSSGKLCDIGVATCPTVTDCSANTLCPAGWQRLSQWGVTDNRVAGDPSCDTGSHGWSDQATESCTYVVQVANQGHADRPYTIWASVKDVGCY